MRRETVIIPASLWACTYPNDKIESVLKAAGRPKWAPDNSLLSCQRSQLSLFVDDLGWTVEWLLLADWVSSQTTAYRHSSSQHLNLAD
jgi:hypothetical protein